MMAEPPAPQSDHEPSGSGNDDSGSASSSTAEEATMEQHPPLMTEDPQVGHFKR